MSGMFPPKSGAGVGMVGPRTSLRRPNIYAEQYQSQLWSFLRQGPLRVAMIGSGNWGSAAAKLIGQNTKEYAFFEKEVRMWVHEEIHEGRKLSELINETHENPKYLPGIKLPENIVAEPDLLKAVEGAHILVFVLPHQYVDQTCSRLVGHVREGAVAVSLIKGFERVQNNIHLMSEIISQSLQVECCALSGANIAIDVAREQFSEATLGYRHNESAQILVQLFDRPYFRVNAVPDVAGVELCGALKNVVALAAGFSDGLKLGPNTKAALIRLGLQEIRQFAFTFYSGISEMTFWQSAGMADLITTCFGGRNRLCAEAFAQGKETWREIEVRLLKGQKLQGTLTCRDVCHVLRLRNRLHEFPLFQAVHRICFEGWPANHIVEAFMDENPRPIPSRL